MYSDLQSWKLQVIQSFLKPIIENLIEIDLKTPYETFLLDFLWGEYTNCGGK